MPNNKSKRPNLIKQAGRPIWISAMIAVTLMITAMYFEHERIWIAITWPDFFNHLQDYATDISSVRLRHAVILTDFTVFLIVWVGSIFLLRLILRAKHITKAMLDENFQRGPTRYAYRRASLPWLLVGATFMSPLLLLFFNSAPHLMQRDIFLASLSTVYPEATFFIEAGVLCLAMTFLGIAIPANFYLALLLIKRAEHPPQSGTEHKKPDHDTASQPASPTHRAQVTNRSARKIASVRVPAPSIRTGGIVSHEDSQPRDRARQPSDKNPARRGYVLGVAFENTPENTRWQKRLWIWSPVVSFFAYQILPYVEPGKYYMDLAELRPVMFRRYPVEYLDKFDPFIWGYSWVLIITVIASFALYWLMDEAMGTMQFNHVTRRLWPPMDARANTTQKLKIIAHRITAPAACVVWLFWITKLAFDSRLMVITDQMLDQNLICMLQISLAPPLAGLTMIAVMTYLTQIVKRFPHK